MLYASKVLTAFFTPLGICVALAILGLILLETRFRRAGCRAVLLSTAMLWITSMPVTARLALGSLEHQHLPLAVNETPPADVAIVLGGAVGGAVSPRKNLDLGDASDRVYHAYELFKAGKVRAILVSGGNLPWSSGAEPEAETIRRLLTSWGVPNDAIFTEGSSRTTAENAREVAAAWPSLGYSSALLVTSAAHMPRALASFKKAGVPILPASTDIHVVDERVGALDFLPNAGALAGTSDALKEAVGYVVYWLRGDI